MKTNSIMIFLCMFLIFCSLAFFSGCYQTKLSNEDARMLIIKTLNLPMTYRHDIYKRPSMGSGFELDGLRAAGLISGSEYLDSRRLIEIQITEMGQSSFIGENNGAYMFKTNDIDFDKITGISINKDEQTATVRFSLKAKNATLVAYTLAKTKAGFSGNNYINYSLINPLNGELVFKKFDNGWQLLEQGKSSSNLLNQILNSDANSSKQDDYSQQIKILRNEIKAKEDAIQAKYSSHSDFIKFWADFKKAVNSVDKQAVLEMTSLPFIDKIEDAYHKSTTLTSTNEKTFMDNFDKIFTTNVIKAINNNTYRQYKFDDFIGGDVIKEGEYLLIVENDNGSSNRETCDLVFVKVGGIFKLSYIPYYS